MPYVWVGGKPITSFNDFKSTIKSTLESAGWELHFQPSGNTLVVPSSNINPSTDTITYNNHGYSDNQLIVYANSSGDNISGLNVGDAYRVQVIDANTFRLKNIHNNSVADITFSGSGNHTFNSDCIVYKSKGEKGDRPTIFLLLSYGLYSYTGYCYINVFRNWDLSSISNRIARDSSYYLTTDSNAELYMYCSKDYVCIMPLAFTGSNYNVSVVGYLPNRFYSTLTASANSGSNVTLSVVDSSGFVVGKTYTIVEDGGPNMQNVTVSSIPSQTQIVVQSLSNSYPSGSFIGLVPLNIGNLHISNETFLFNNVTYQINKPLYTTAGATDDFIGLYRLFSFYVENRGTIGYNDDYIYSVGNPGSHSNGTAYVLNRLVSGTSTGSNTATTLNDTSKNWTTDEFADKVVAIVGGTGDGQVRKIISNTSTQLTVTPGWYTTPNSTSQYIICDGLYRKAGAFCFREGV